MTESIQDHESGVGVYLGDHDSQSITQTAGPDSREIGFNRRVLASSFVAALSALNFGWCVGEPNIPEAIIEQCLEGPETYINGFPTCLPMNSTLWGLVVGLVALGALVGSLVAGRAADKFGRKTVLLANNFFFIVGALLLGTSTTIAQLAVGRFVSGIGCGVASTVVATYNSECSPVKARGLMGTMLQFTVEIGIFLSQFIAIFLVRVPGWRILFGLSGGISLIQVLLLPMLPESPKFLISHGRLTEAEQALRFLRPNYDITNEFNDMLLAGNPSHVPRTDFVPVEGQSTTSVNKARITSAVMPKINVNASPELSMVAGSGYATKTVGIMDILRGRTPDVISHMVFCTLFLTGFQQWTGAKGIVFYSTEILAKVFKLNHAQLAKIPNKPQKMTIGISVTGILAVFISMLLMDRLGRRRLLLLSTGGLTVSCLLIFIGEIASADILAVLAMFVYKIMYGLGMAPIPWLAASEMVPYYALGTLSGVASALNWTMIFAIGMTFPHMAHALQDYLFLPFAVLNLAAFAVVLLFMPETKGKSIADILRDHGRPIHFVLKFSWARRTNTDSAASAQPYTA